MPPLSPAVIDAVLLALAWLGYFAMHSVLAAVGVKRFAARCFPRAMPAYRLGYNLLAVVSLAPPLWLLGSGAAMPLWEWRGVGQWAAAALGLCAAGGFALSLKYYDGREFLGLRQLEQRDSRGVGVEDQADLCLSPLHRYTRHPWYTLILVFIWSRDMDSLMLMTAALVTLYLIVGSRLEERKLVLYYGEVYEEYRAMVPGLLPRPWRRLKPTEADELIRKHQAGKDCRENHP